MKIRNLVIVATAFTLLTLSLNGISLNEDKKLNLISKDSSTFHGGTSPIKIPPMTADSSTKTIENSAGSATKSTPSSSESPSPSLSQPTTQPPIQPSPSTSANSLVLQVENSGHYKLFPTMVKKGPSVKDPQGEHYGDDCIRCHSAVKRLDDPTAKLDDFFPGGKYANQAEGISCRVCHKAANNQSVLREKGWDTCGTCHVNSTGNPIPGIEVHHPQYQMIQGVAIGDILPMPSYKYKYLKDSFSCTSCHVTNENKHDFLVPGVKITHDSEGIRRVSTTIDFQEFKTIFKQDSCDVCHPSTTETVNRVKEIQTVIGKKLDELEPIYEEWSTKVQSMDPKDPRVLTFKNGATYYTYVYSDGSKGVHNFPYARLLLEKAERIWRDLQL